MNLGKKSKLLIGIKIQKNTFINFKFIYFYSTFLLFLF